MPASPDARRARWLQRFRALPEKLRLALVAVLGALIGLLTYEIVYFLNPLTPRAPTSWLAAFAIGVPRQYSLHRWLTFDSRLPYGPRLARAYLLYAAIAVLTTGLNWLLVERLGAPHRLAWLACITTTGLINLFALKRWVFGAPPDTSPPEPGDPAG
jgi:putative flippase GtrA